MNKLFTIATILYFSVALCQAQELIYDISFSGKKVGSLLVTKTEIDQGKYYYTALSDVQYTLFRKTEMMYFYEAIFEDNLLTKAYFIYKKNGEVEEEAKLLWGEEGTYLSNIESFHKSQKTMLNKSMVQMYFQKPSHKALIFSERFHDYVTVAEIVEEGKFIFYIPNGDKSVYSYTEDGVCNKVSINSTFINLEISLVSRSDKN